MWELLSYEEESSLRGAFLTINMKTFKVPLARSFWRSTGSGPGQCSGVWSRSIVFRKNGQIRCRNYKPFDEQPMEITTLAFVLNWVLTSSPLKLLARADQIHVDLAILYYPLCDLGWYSFEYWKFELLLVLWFCLLQKIPNTTTHKYGWKSPTTWRKIRR